jgi:hypothetical protein
MPIFAGGLSLPPRLKNTIQRVNFENFLRIASPLETVTKASL